jgi:outer membrane protein assembly factor BamD (BamD/ComL family)
LSQWRAAYDGKLIKGPTNDEKADVTNSTDSQTLFDRWLTPRRTPSTKGNDTGSTLVLGSDGWRPIIKPAKNPKADAELQAAHKLFQQGNFPEAEKQFAKIAKDRKGTTWGEEAQFYLAETQFQRKKYIASHDSFEQPIKDYTSASDYKDKAVSREYAIAQIWIFQQDPESPRDKVIPWYGRFDGRLPPIDTAGSALQALEHVRQNDPTGPLADNASIEIANHYMRHRDYDSAALYYDQFVNSYPRSPFLQEAQHAAIDARMKAFLGPEYDASGLEKARKMVEQTIESFPERRDSVERLYHTLDLINEAEAEKTFKTGMYYKKIRKVPSAEYYFGKIPQRWPNSPFAQQAKIELAQLAKMPRTTTKPTKIFIRPGATDPFGGMGMGMGMGMGGMGMGGMGMGGMGMGGMGGMM